MQPSPKNTSSALAPSSLENPNVELQKSATHTEQPDVQEDEQGHASEQDVQRMENLATQVPGPHAPLLQAVQHAAEHIAPRFFQRRGVRLCIIFFWMIMCFFVGSLKLVSDFTKAPWASLVDTLLTSVGILGGGVVLLGLFIHRCCPNRINRCWQLVKTWFRNHCCSGTHQEELQAHQQLDEGFDRPPNQNPNASLTDTLLEPVEPLTCAIPATSLPSSTHPSVSTITQFGNPTLTPLPTLLPHSPIPHSNPVTQLSPELTLAPIQSPHK